MMWRGRRAAGALLVLALLQAGPVRAESPEQWVELGARVHGAFGAFIPLGIRIGLDALQRLEAKPREVTVVYFDSDAAPCACIADGLIISAAASPGQRTLRIAAEKAREGLLGAVEIRHRSTGKGMRYEIPLATLPRLAEWNRTLPPLGRYEAVMQAQGLFMAEPLP